MEPNDPPSHGFGGLARHSLGEGRSSAIAVATEDDNRVLPPALASVEDIVRKARKGLVRQAQLDAAGRGFFWGAIVSGVAIVVARLAGLSSTHAWWLLLIAAAGALLGMLVGRNSCFAAKRCFAE